MSPAKGRPPVTIASREVEVDVSLEAPRILAYRLKATGGVILGSLGIDSPAVIVSKRGGEPVTRGWRELSPKVKTSRNAVVFSCAAKVGTKVAATFDWAIRVSGNTVTIAAERVKETAGYDLNEFLLPADPLVRVTGDLPGARACVGDLVGEHWRRGGLYDSPAEPGRIAKPGGELPKEVHFGLVYTEKAAAGIYSNCLHKMGEKPVRTLVAEGSTGLYVNHHCYSYRDENYEPFWCKVGIVGDLNGDGVIDWKDAACFIHQAIPRRVELREDSIKYMANHGMDFDSFADDLIRKVCNLSDGQPQMVLLSGWNGWGWDSEYPTWDHPGEEYGGREGLYRLHREAHKHRAHTSMIHNFDDAYQGTRMWDDAIIARREDGRLWDATWWSGGPSFILGPYRFWKTGLAKETLDGLMSQGMERQIFSDVFTILPWRDDPDPADPVGPETNLVLGKFKLLDYLARHDIYMNSEGFNYEMLGRYIGAHNGYQVEFSSDPGRPPLAWFICHGLVNKKYWRLTDDGRFRGEDTEVLRPTNPDALYRWAMLLGFYGDKPVRDFRPVEGGYCARYGDDVEVTWIEQEGVSVKLGGVMIADGQSVLLPKPQRGKDLWNVLRAFTATGETMRYPRPKGWKELSQLTVLALTPENPPTPVANEGKVAFEGDELVINIPSYHPFKLVYGEARLASEMRFQPFPKKAAPTFPLDEVIERAGAAQRPAWVRVRTRQHLEQPRGTTLCVGSSSVWPTREEATRHSAWIVARKMAWFLRQNYVEHGHSRAYEKLAGATRDALGYENWYLGHEACVRRLTVEGLNARAGVRWYWEKVRHGFDRQEGWKAFVCVPFTDKDGHELYQQAAQDRIAECEEGLAKNPAPEERARLELNIKVYRILLEQEATKMPQPLKFQV